MSNCSGVAISAGHALEVHQLYEGLCSIQEEQQELEKALQQSLAAVAALESELQQHYSTIAHEQNRRAGMETEAMAVYELLFVERTQHAGVEEVLKETHERERQLQDSLVKLSHTIMYGDTSNAQYFSIRGWPVPPAAGSGVDGAEAVPCTDAAPVTALLDPSELATRLDGIRLRLNHFLSNRCASPAAASLPSSTDQNALPRPCNDGGTAAGDAGGAIAAMQRSPQRRRVTFQRQSEIEFVIPVSGANLNRHEVSQIPRRKGRAITVSCHRNLDLTRSSTAAASALTVAVESSKHDSASDYLPGAAVAETEKDPAGSGVDTAYPMVLDEMTSSAPPFSFAVSHLTASLTVLPSTLQHPMTRRRRTTWRLVREEK